MVHSKPFVSIGMPVYNGEPYIRQALDSLLAQDYANFELIISDNASTDRTQEICLEYAARDKRIRYYRNQTNMGAVWNFNRVFELSSGEYFMWASHDDYWDPRYIRSCLEAFDTSEAIVLAGAASEIINPETGDVVLADEPFSTIGLAPRDRFMRFKSMADGGMRVWGIFYGVHKRHALRQVMPIRNVVGCDGLLLAELCFHGEFVAVEERLMVKRWGGASANIGKLARALGISNQLRIRFPYVVREVLLGRIIFQTDKLTLPQKIRLACWCHSHSFRLLIIRTLRLVYRRLPAFAKRRAVRSGEPWTGQQEEYQG